MSLYSVICQNNEMITKEKKIVLKYFFERKLKCLKIN